MAVRRGRLTLSRLSLGLGLCLWHGLTPRSADARAGAQPDASAGCAAYRASSADEQNHGKKSKCTWPGWPSSLPDRSWCESGCGVAQGWDCCEKACCAQADGVVVPPPPAAPPSLPPAPPQNSSPGRSSDTPATTSCDAAVENWKCVDGWAKTLATDPGWCASGCGVAEGQICCAAACCQPPPPPPPPPTPPKQIAACIPFNLSTRHLMIIVNDSDMSAHRRLSPEPEEHTTLLVGTSVAVGCSPGYVAPENLAFLKGVDMLTCASGDGGGLSQTRLTCVPPAIAPPHTGLSSTSDKRLHQEVDDGHQADLVSVMTLALFCAAALATVVGKRKQREAAENAYGPTRRSSRFERSMDEESLEMGLVSSSVENPAGVSMASVSLFGDDAPKVSGGHDGLAAGDKEDGGKVDLQESWLELGITGDSPLSDDWSAGMQASSDDSSDAEESSLFAESSAFHFDPGELSTSSDGASDSGEESSELWMAATPPIVLAEDAGGDDGLCARPQGLTADEIRLLPLPPSDAVDAAVEPLLDWNGRECLPGESLRKKTPRRSGGSSSSGGRGGTPCHCQVKGCNYEGATRAHVKRHMRSHTGDRPFVCSEPGCGYAASQKEHLVTHSLKHSTLKPFKCAICGFATKRKEHLTRHMRRHEGDKK